MIKVLLVILVGVLYAIVFAVGSVTTNQTCIDAGYDYSRMSLLFDSYCIRWDGDKQIDIPLENVRRK